MNYYGFVSLFNGIVALTLGIYLFWKNPNDMIYRSFSFLTISIALWAIIYAIWLAQTDKAAALFFIRLGMAPCYFIPFAFLWFCQNLCDESVRDKKLPQYFFIPFVWAGLGFTHWLVADVTPRLFFPYWPVPGVPMHAVIIIFSLTIVCAFWLLLKAWSQSAGSKKWQLKWVTITTAVMWAGGLTNWFLWYNIPIPPLPNFLVAVCLLLLAYAIVRHRLFDIDTLADIVREARLSAIGMMAMGLNHELRNPLYVAKGRIESHLDAIERGIYADIGQEVAKSREILDSALAQLARAMDIMQRFSNFARPYKLEEPKQNVVVRDVVQDVINFAAHEFEFEKIKLTEQPTDGLSVHANRRQLEEIFFNLIVNACHAMQEQGGDLAIRAYQPNGKVIVEVADTGPGIPEENQRRIFEPFYTTKAEKGTGLGLYITKQLVERNGGKISVKSKPGEGSRFILEFKKADSKS